MKTKVAVFGTVGKSVAIETDAPSRAEVTAQIAAAVANVTPAGGGGSSATAVIWRFIREVPKNISSLATFVGAGLLVRKSDSTYAARSVATTDSLDLTVTNGDGVAGNPTVGLGTATVASLALADTAIQPADPLFDTTLLTDDDETAVFPNSRMLLAGTNITFDDSTPGARTVSASGGAGGGNITPDTHPNSPNAQDDEFEEGTLNARWTWRNQGSATAPLSQGSVALTAAAASGDDLKIIEQTLPGGACRYRARLAVDAAVNFSAGGMCILDSSSGKLITVGQASNSGPKYAVYKFNSVTSFNSAPYIAADSGAYGGTQQFVYFEIEYDGTNVFFRVSGSGVDGTFQTLFSEAAASFIGAPDRIGLFVSSNNGSLIVITACDWFRKVA